VGGVGRDHLAAIQAVLDVLEKLTPHVRKWVLSQVTSSRPSKAPSIRLQTRVQRTTSTALQTRVQATSNDEVQREVQREVQATSNALQTTNERETLVLAFSTFWSIYPRKQSKQEALRNYLKLQPNLELQDRILQALHEQKASDQWSRDEGRFIPLPSTWLHQQRFNDEVAPSNATSNVMFGKTPSKVFEGFMEGHRRDEGQRRDQ
jgi:hypothetical protein